MKFLTVVVALAASVSGYALNTTTIEEACAVTTIYTTVTVDVPVVKTPSAPVGYGPTAPAPYPTAPAPAPYWPIKNPIGTAPSGGYPKPSGTAPSASFTAPPQFTGAAAANGVPVAAAGLLAAVAYLL